VATFTATLDEVIETGVNLGLDSYPIFDEAYRESLNAKIIDHFRFREIGHETFTMFTYALRRKMNEIMPLYNQLYKSERLTIDPLNTISMRTVADSLGSSTMDTTSESHGENASTSDGSSRTVSSETPQMRLAGNGDYATGAQDATSRTTATGTADDRGTVAQSTEQTGKTESETAGWQGSQALMLLQFRQTFLNIDMQVIEELEPLFMQVWDNGDEFTERGYYGYGFGLFPYSL